MTDELMIILFVFGGIIAIFFLLRELNTWYWKINERVILQKQTNSYLSVISDQLSEMNKRERSKSVNEVS
jgi:hypothetical protein